jgi:hypothetical protein
MIRTKMKLLKSGAEALAIGDVVNVNRLVFLDRFGAGKGHHPSLFRQLFLHPTEVR